MSNEQAQAIAPATELSDEQVREYLKLNGDFLQRNPDMLDHLHISHASGSAVSLVEKQVSVLRERNIDMRHRLNALTTNARDNDKLYEQTRKLVLALLDASNLDSVYSAFMDAMEKDFKVDYASLILFGEPSSDGKCRVETSEAAKIEIGALLKGRKPVCGVLRKEELAYLFPDAGEVGSAALMPLANGEELGLIAVGSADANRYSSSMGTLFLTHIADVIVRLLPHLK
ncbi:DUF484 family protein [Halieaceae bacterium IMCC8485]|jgi:uncharacterized protein YigA (DUF484 family)|uniref:DUF484 family protein n=1 Tax=Candidatus Seongchinamella marina TaxID=2518990 RepID=A0ABT3SX21_9GAMM|nr:DUF484 family protein [Candidatus Seongchinamella marina]MCX2974146.1 DUF484 family protein [Candidatus Seongchinamella marina]